MIITEAVDEYLAQVNEWWANRFTAKLIVYVVT